MANTPAPRQGKHCRKVCDYEPAMTRNALVIVLSIFAAVGANTARAQSTSSSLCQVELRPAVLAIRTAIEKHDHHPVQCTIDYGLHNAGMDQHDGGIGRIEVNPRLGGQSERTITHELMHLQLDVEGWPTLPPTPFIQTADVLARHIVDERLWSAVQHQEIFKRMRKMGIDPNDNFLAEVRSHRGEVPPGFEQFPQFAAVLLLRVEQSGDVALIADTESAFNNRGLSKSVKVTRDLRAEILRSSPVRPSDSISLVHRCSKIVWSALPSGMTLTVPQLQGMDAHANSQ
jgi:hypothetical protein